MPCRETRLGSNHRDGRAGERPARMCRGPARQVAAPPRGRRAERNAPAAPARGRAAVGVASAPPSLPLAAARQDGPGPAGHWLRGPHICIRAGRGARALGREGARGAAAAAEVGPRAGDRPAPGGAGDALGGPRPAGGGASHKPPALASCRGSDARVGGEGGLGCGMTPPPARRPSRRRAATAHRTLRCSGPTVRVTAADLFLGSATAPAPLLTLHCRVGEGHSGRREATGSQRGRVQVVVVGGGRVPLWKGLPVCVQQTPRGWERKNGH